jgi:undecaprenyl-diphosphatase
VKIAEYIVLGIIQGLTEFLPVSSSTHLVLAEHWMGLNPSGVTTEIVLHVGTLLSVLLVYGKDLWRVLISRNWRYIGCLALATAVTVACLFPVKDLLEALTESPNAARIEGGMLFITAIMLWLADRRLQQGPGKQPLGWLNSILIGGAQFLGALPGISRSGATISTAVLLGIDREQAARFSFQLSIPVIIGAALIHWGELSHQSEGVLQEFNSGQVDPLGLALGFLASMIMGIVAIYLVLWMLKRARLLYFAIYCAALAVVALIIG